jgi:hypothetical protein
MSLIKGKGIRKSGYRKVFYTYVIPCELPQGRVVDVRTPPEQSNGRYKYEMFWCAGYQMSVLNVAQCFL